MNLPSTYTPKITTGIVDDSQAYREALIYYFSQLDDIEIVLVAEDGLQFIQQLEKK